jgi:hypothetical protein
VTLTFLLRQYGEGQSAVGLKRMRKKVTRKNEYDILLKGFPSKESQ